MKKIFRSLVPFAAATAGILAIGMANPARASLVIQLSTNGMNWDTVATEPSGTTASYTNANYHGFNVNALNTDSNSPGTPSLTLLEGAVLHVTNNNSTSATLYIKLGDTDFTAPITPPSILLQSHIGGSVTVAGAHNTLTFQSYVDPADGQNSLTGFTPGPQTPTVTAGSYNNDASTLITSGLTSPYSITEYLKFTLDPRSQLGFQSNTTLSAVPEPSSLALSCIGILGLVGYAWRRRTSISRGRRGAGRTDVRK
jgi:hypothetical protein